MGKAKRPVGSTEQQNQLLPLEARLGVDAVESPPDDAAPNRARLFFGPVMLPIPPSANAYWRQRVIKLKNPSRKQLLYTGGYSAIGYIAPEAQAYRDQVKEMITQLGFRMSSSALRVEIVVCFSDNRRQDIDNRVKPLIDALKEAGVMEDDTQVVELSVKRGPVIKEGRIVVRVFEIIPDYDRALYATGWGKLGTSFELK